MTSNKNIQAASNTIQLTIASTDNSACHGLCFSRFAPGTNRASLELPVKRMLFRNLNVRFATFAVISWCQSPATIWWHDQLLG